MALDDSAQWNKTAVRFLGGTGFVRNAADLDPKRPPVYPLFLAGTYAVFGTENFAAAKGMQALLGALACALLYGLAFVLAGPRTALWASAACAVYPPLIVYAGILQSETLFTAFLLLFALLLLLVRDHSARWPIAAAGILLGLLNLCKGTMLFFPLFLLGLSAVLKEERPRFGRYLALAAISFAVVAPWTWRNWKVYGRPVPVATGGPEMLWFGTLPWPEQRMFGNAPSYQKFAGMSPLEAEDAFKRAALDNIRRDPLGYLGLTVRKFVFFWFQPVGARLAGRANSLFGWAAYAAHALLIALFVFGIVKSRRYWRNFAVPYWIVGYFMLVHVLTAPEPRYRLPIEPFILLLAAHGLERRKEAVHPA